MPQPRDTIISDGFAPLVAPLEIEVLERMPASVCGLWPDLQIGYVNPAWVAFAHANGAPEVDWRSHLGTSMLDAVPATLRAFYESLFGRATATGVPVEHDYDCSNASHHRRYRMAIHACAGGARVVVHSLVHEKPHDVGASVTHLTHEALDATYRDERGMISQCSNCRRIRRPSSCLPQAQGAVEGTSPEWDWVPAYVERLPPRTSHAICEVCADFYYR